MAREEDWVMEASEIKAKKEASLFVKTGGNTLVFLDVSKKYTECRSNCLSLGACRRILMLPKGAKTRGDFRRDQGASPKGEGSA